MQLTRRMWSKAKPRWSNKLTGDNGSTKLKTLDKIQKKQPPKDYGGEGGKQKHKDQVGESKLEEATTNNKQRSVSLFSLLE